MKVCFVVNVQFDGLRQGDPLIATTGSKRGVEVSVVTPSPSQTPVERGEDDPTSLPNWRVKGLT